MLRPLKCSLLLSVAWRRPFAAAELWRPQQQQPPTPLTRNHNGDSGSGGQDRIVANSSNAPRQTAVLPGSVFYARGGGINVAFTRGRGNKWQDGVNRRAIPAPEALSRYPNLKSPGGLVRFLDYVGTVSFAMSGAATAGMRGMNLLGCIFVGVLAATGGGTVRDLLLGQTPVFWLVEVEYVTICVVTAVVTFVLWPVLSRVSVLSHMGTGLDGWLSQAIDTVGLASFAVAATQNGIRRKCHPGTTIVICCITCSGGGILRDVLTSSPVMALSSHAQMYVSTAAFGSGAYLLARKYSKDPLFRICAGFFTVVILRLLACLYDLRLPRMV
ncbi:unnamed protein product [Ectocarpus sp. 4 AP-2014]